MVDIQGWKIGLSICYDLRFPELYRHYSRAGCNALLVPAAFTYVTGQAHWEPLLRARAIENQCYVIAAAQCGYHAEDRKTWGHSMFVDPWGEIISEADELMNNGQAGVIYADLDCKQLEKIRSQLPAGI
ncbi:MAG: nitrilase-related carbon-nitrogen hydrolase [Mariprofundales bacterium]